MEVAAETAQAAMGEIKMLTTLIFGVTPSLTESVSRLCSEFGDICVYKTLDSYRSPHEVGAPAQHVLPGLDFLAVDVGGRRRRVRLPGSYSKNGSSGSAAAPA